MNRALAVYDAVSISLVRMVYAIMVLVMFVQVVLRYVFNAPLMWPEELSRLLFLWLVFGAAPLATSRKAHLAVDFFVNFLPRGIRLKLKLSLYIFVMAFLLLIVVYGFQLTRQFIGVGAFTMDFLPLGLFYLPVCLGPAMMVINLIRTIPELISETKLPAMSSEIEEAKE